MKGSPLYITMPRPIARVDWAGQGHAVPAAVKRVRRSRGVGAADLEPFTAVIREQAD